MNMTLASFPVPDGSPVTPAHVAICADRGHATHVVGGIDAGICPRCGEVTAPAVDPNVETFERLLDLEAAVRGERVSVAFAPTGLPDYLVAARHENLRAAKARLFAAVDALTPDQLRCYGQYRSTAR